MHILSFNISIVAVRCKSDWSCICCSSFRNLRDVACLLLIWYHETCNSVWRIRCSRLLAWLAFWRKSRVFFTFAGSKSAVWLRRNSALINRLRVWRAGEEYWTAWSDALYKWRYACMTSCWCCIRIEAQALTSNLTLSKGNWPWDSSKKRATWLNTFNAALKLP